jgi:hypothetical protein
MHILVFVIYLYITPIGVIHTVTHIFSCDSDPGKKGETNRFFIAMWLRDYFWT